MKMTINFLFTYQNIYSVQHTGKIYVLSMIYIYICIMYTMTHGRDTS